MENNGTSVDFLDLSAPYRELKSQMDEVWSRVNQKGWYLLGDELTRFEQNFARYCEASQSLGVANGLDALTLILRGYGIGSGDEVIVPAHTFIATWLAVTAAGATIVPVDADPVTMNIDPKLVEAKITPKTKAIMPVHLYGQPADISELRKVIAGRDIKIIEDAAQAHGATHHGKRCGSLGDAAAFSFYPGKNLGALGDAGGVTTSDAKLFESVKSLRNYGARVKYHHESLGVNSRLDEVQAGILDIKLQTLDSWNAKRVEIAGYYSEAFSNVPGLEFPKVLPGNNPVWHLYVIRTEKRDELQKHLLDQKVHTIIHYPIPCHLAEAYRSLGFKKGAFPVAERISKTCLSLPIGPHMSQAQVQKVVDSVRSFFKS